MRDSEREREGRRATVTVARHVSPTVPLFYDRTRRGILRPFVNPFGAPGLSVSLAGKVDVNKKVLLAFDTRQ